MTRFSSHFGLGKSQRELDFVDIHLDRDLLVFVDPFAISQRPDRWSQDAHAHLMAYFQRIVDAIREGRPADARTLLSSLHEPNETRLGFSRRRPQGAGIGSGQADKLFAALMESNAVQTGFLNSLEECELLINGIGPDKISDLTTNVIRSLLANYTSEQCDLHGIATQRVALKPGYSLSAQGWVSDYGQLPVVAGRAVLLVPRSIVRVRAAYNHQDFYRHFALDFLQAEHLAAGSALVHALKNGRRRVYKKDLEALHPLSKEFLYEFAKQHPEVLAQYREQLAQMENREPNVVVDELDESVLAASLRAALNSIPPGGARASDYHKLMVGALELIFFPALVHPRKEVEIHQGRKRIDILMENSAKQGIFFNLHTVRKLPSAFVAIECKNYQTDVANPELDQLASRFSPNRGKVGFLCCRRFDDRDRFIERCRDTLLDDRGLIVALDDERVDMLLAALESRRRSDVDGILTGLINEVWIG